MWTTHHNSWVKIKKVSTQTIIYSLLMLFFASFFPYTTALVADNFQNAVAQSVYGVIVLAVTFSNLGISHSINVANEDVHLGLLYTISDAAVVLDITIKIIGLVLTMTIFPPATLIAVFLSMMSFGFNRHRWASGV
ncbi:hypothetical protein OKN36_13030 [Furfurilactobacillus sp. OKN36]